MRMGSSWGGAAVTTCVPFSPPSTLGLRRRGCCGWAKFCGLDMFESWLSTTRESACARLSGFPCVELGLKAVAVGQRRSSRYIHGFARPGLSF